MAIVSALSAPSFRPLRGAARELGRGARRGDWNHGLYTAAWHQHPLMATIPLLLFALMGLYLPAHKWPRLGHALGQLLLVSLATVTVVNDGRTFPFVYMVLVIRGCLMFGLRGRITLASLALMLFLGGLVFRLRSLSGLGRRLPPGGRDRLHHFVMNLQLNFVVLFCLALLLVVLLINALLTERESQQRLQQANQRLQSSAQEIEKLAMDQERNRIARDIHDSLGHSLTALNVQLESALKLWDKNPAKAQQFLSQAKRLGTQSLQEVRQSVATLRQDPLAGNSLKAAIAQLLQDMQTAHPHLHIHSDLNLTEPLPSNLNVILYRILQEGLTNIIKHARAQTIHLHLTRSKTLVSLTLEDDGVGFAPDQVRAGFGLQSMRDRAEAAGGTFTIQQRNGTRLQINLPIPQIAQKIAQR